MPRHRSRDDEIHEAIFNFPGRLAREVDRGARERQHHDRMKKPERDRPAERDGERASHRFLDERRHERRELTKETVALEVRGDDTRKLKNGRSTRAAQLRGGARGAPDQRDETSCVGPRRSSTHVFGLNGSISISATRDPQARAHRQWTGPSRSHRSLSCRERSRQSRRVARAIEHDRPGAAFSSKMQSTSRAPGAPLNPHPSHSRSTSERTCTTGNRGSSLDHSSCTPAMLNHHGSSLSRLVAVVSVGVPSAPG